MIVRFFLCLLLACCLPAMAQQPGLEVGVQRHNTDMGNVYEVNAQGDVAAAPAAVWRVLTDYERMPEYVPDLHTTKVLSRSGEQVVLEQTGTAHLLFFRRAIHLIVQVREQPMAQLDVSLLEGDMKVYQCTWRLIPIPDTGGTRVLYSGKMAPKFYVPGMLGSNMIRSDIEKMLAAVLARLDRPG
jgi:ribosome-associated toxin RatA of RatAB toxin-antitoxin module